MNLNNINCVVTGASSGIGREISLILASKGCTVLAIARDEARLNELTVQSSSLKGTMLPLVFDLQDIDNYTQLSKIIKVKMGEIDLLINNAALGHYSEFSNQNTEEILKVINTTLIAPILVTNTCLDLMRNNQSAIVFISSLAGKMGFPNLSTYSAAKHGLEGFVDTLTQELKNNIFIFRPGVTGTKFFERSGMVTFEKEAKKSGLMRSANGVAVELICALEKDRKEYTIGNDRFLIPILPIITRRSRFAVLNVLNKLAKILN